MHFVVTPPEVAKIFIGVSPATTTSADATLLRLQSKLTNGHAYNSIQIHSPHWTTHTAWHTDVCLLFCDLASGLCESVLAVA